MITFLLSITILILGYVFYGRFITRLSGVDSNRKTPAVAINDGVDFTPLPVWKVFMIQFLNIAGLGPIFGAILGAAFGPMAYLWIVLGCIFFGAVHDFFSGFISLRNNGQSLPELVGKYLGKYPRNFMRIFTFLLLIFVGVAFVSGPAKLLTGITSGGLEFWLVAIFAYYFFATIFPIDKIIGRIYPFFGVTLLLMAILIGGAIIFYSFSGSLNLHEISLEDFKNYHRNPETNMLYPMMFIVISCGAISGFHATQSPLMARCLTNEKQTRFAFYGAMIAEGIVAIIWATAAMNYFGDVHGLNYELSNPAHDPAWIVNEISRTWLGKIGAIIAIIGVVVCPITSGDTAFRSARLIIADAIKIDQKPIKQRLFIALPIFLVAVVLTFGLSSQFATIWKFVGISNQILAVITLWTISMCLSVNKKNHLITTIPALILTTICFTYILVAPHKNAGLALTGTWPFVAGVIFAIIVYFLWNSAKKSKMMRNNF